MTNLKYQSELTADGDRSALSKLEAFFLCIIKQVLGIGIHIKLILPNTSQKQHKNLLSDLYAEYSCSILLYLITVIGSYFSLKAFRICLHALIYKESHSF